MMPWRLTRPKVGLRPTTPQKLAGTRTDPPVSVPVAAIANPAATAFADPLLEPPVYRAIDHGFLGVPKMSVVPQANSPVLVLPRRIIPCCSSRSTNVAFSVGTKSARAREWAVVLTPFVQTISLCAIGRPWRGLLR